MSEPGQPSDRKWDLGNPQTLLAIIGIVVSLAGSVFGVALAMPLGQDLLCQNFGMSCAHVKMMEAQLNMSAIDFDGWCDNYLQTTGKDPFPPPGYTGTRADCRLDATRTGERGYTSEIAYTKIDADMKPEGDEGVTAKSPGIVLIANLSIKHEMARVALPFSIRPACWRHNPDDRAWEHVGCELSPPTYNLDALFGSFDTYQGDAAASSSPPGSLPQTMAQYEVDFIKRWRLDIEGQPTTDVTPGDYRVELTVGAPGEAIQPFLLRAGFTIEAPQAPGPN